MADPTAHGLTLRQRDSPATFRMQPRLVGPGRAPRCGGTCRAACDPKHEAGAFAYRLYKPSRPMRWHAAALARGCAQAWKADCHAALSASRCEPESRGASGQLPKFSACHPTKSLNALGGSLVGCHSGRTSCERAGEAKDDG